MTLIRLGRSAGLAAACALAELATVSHPGVAQRRSELVYILHSDTPGVPDLDLRTVHPFRAHAVGDAATAGFHLTGNFSPKMDNYSPCSNTVYSCQNVRVRSSFNNSTVAPWFQLEWAFGAPPTDFRRIKAVAPSVSNALGGGWSAGSNDMVLGRPNRFGPRDGSLGELFAGVTTTNDGSCRDFSGFGNGQHPAGLPLLAASGCPGTWPSSGWGGDAPIDQAGWQAQLAATGASFAWDFWRVPASRKRTDKRFMGTGWSTYGETSDHYQDILAAYGSVVPGGTGKATLDGYPLGLLLRFDAFTFGTPTMQGVLFIQALIINRSQDVWGAPVNYDSLYFGLTDGVLFSIPSSANYYMPQLNTALFLDRGATSGQPNGPCTQAFRVPTGVGGCPPSPTNSSGYRNGSAAIIVLKSPLGDVRNKLFTRRNGVIANGAVVGATACTVGADPFCDPTNPARGDTITFSRGGMGGFGNVDSYTWGTGAQASFGFMAGDEVNTNAGRTLTAQATTIQYRTFENVGYPGIIGVYNKYAPGQGGQPGNTWDWNHDGVPDTLALDTCEKRGCVAPGSDTVPGGTINNSGNLGGVLAFGPFSLKAGDTTSFVFAHIGGADSADVWNQISNAVDAYMSFYASPDAPPKARIQATAVAHASDASGTTSPSVQLFWSEDAEHWTDPYLTKIAADLTGAPAGSPNAILLADNPGLAAAVTARARNNLEAVEVYKSCDNGVTYTATSGCTGQPTYDDKGQPVGLGWAPYASFSVDANAGNPPNSLTDANVRGGRTYLYTIVGKSRGAGFLIQRRPTGGTIPCGTTGANCVADTIRYEPTIRNTLSTFPTDSNVASIYVPLSREAGYQPAKATLAQSDARVTLPLTFAFTSALVPGDYRLLFGNKFIVRRDSLVSSASVTTYVVVQDTVVSDPSRNGTAPGVAKVVSSDTLVRANHDVFPVDLGPNAPFATVGPALTGAGSDTVRITTTYTREIGYVVTSGTAPLWLSVFAFPASTTPSGALGLSDFPGFTLTAQQSNAGVFNSLSYSNTTPLLDPLPGEFQFRGAAAIAREKLTAADTIVPRSIVNSFMVQWAEGAPSTRVTYAAGTALNANAGVGRYEADWAADPFNTETGFVLNQSNPTATQNQVVAALTARATATTGVVDTTAARLTGVALEDLVAVKLPFTVKNLTERHAVQIAMRRRVNNTILLGSGEDTVRITVPADVWVPGDHLFFIENLVTDSVTPTGTVLDASSQPVELTGRPTLTFNPAVLGCQTTRLSCNPVPQASPGATGYAPIYAGDRTQWEYYSGFRADSRYTFSVVAPVTGTAISQVTDSALAQIRVVPNPYVLYSQYPGTDATSSLLYFTGVPETGTLRIYTITGQFVQQITWSAGDLTGSGDLAWDLKSRGGLRVASGLYLWVLTTPSQPGDPTSAALTARGKLVVVQGQAR